MSALKQSLIICDNAECFEIYGLRDNSKSVSQQRESARMAGWVYSSGKDLCPECRPKTITGQNIKSRKIQK